MATTSVVIPVWNGLDYLRRNLPVVLRLEAEEVIVVDDASSDGSAEFIGKRYPQVKLISHQVNRRFPISVNDGFAAASGDVIILLNQDVMPEGNLIKNALRHFNDQRLFAVTFNEANRSWAKGEIKNGFLEFTHGEKDGQVHESLWASGGSAAFRKSLWDELGGFDPIFTPGYFEDLDLGWRARKAGYKILWDPRCKVEHVTETAFNKAFSPRQLQLIKERNYLLAHWKNLTAAEVRQHLGALGKRIIRYPGYIVPVLMTIYQFLKLKLIYLTSLWASALFGRREGRYGES